MAKLHESHLIHGDITTSNLLIQVHCIQIEKIQDWFGENYTLDDFARACNKFDTKTERRDIARLCKQQPALNAGVYMTSNEINDVSEPPVNSREDGRLFTSGKGPSESQEPESIIIDGDKL